MAGTPGSSRPDPPAPAPDIVTASRRHLAGKYARGVDKLFWELEQRPMRDGDAVRAVLSETTAGQPADALDIGAALVLVHAMRLDLDLLEADVLDTARASGMSAESVAAVLELPGAEAAECRHRMLRARRKLPRAAVRVPRFRPVPEASLEAAEHTGRPTDQAPGRAAGARRRKDQLKAPS